MERVNKLIERIEASTDPFEAKLGNKYAYVKIFGSRWSNKVLINGKPYFFKLYNTFSAQY